MEKETLFTFNFTAPPDTNRVELLGSWDNFTQAYAMQLDRRRSSTHWTGCFRFENVIFDGRSTSFTAPRCGGLLQGGMYWYFFRLDDSIETCDDARFQTSACPLLPGQTMNVVEIPLEPEQEEVMRPRSDSGVFGAMEKPLLSQQYQYTLDPATKYAPFSPTKNQAWRCSADTTGKTRDTNAEADVRASRSEPRRLSRLWGRSVSRATSPTKRPESETIEPVESAALQSPTSDIPDAVSTVSDDAQLQPMAVKALEQQLVASEDIPMRVPSSTSHKDSHDGDILLPDELLPPSELSDASDKTDTHSRKVMTVWKTLTKVHLRSSRGEQCFQISIPQELAWSTPKGQMIESVQCLAGHISS